MVDEHGAALPGAADEALRDLETAIAKLRGVAGNAVPSISVADAAQRWLTTYIPTTRNEKGQKLTADRVRQFLVPYFGERPIAEIVGDDIRHYRLWLERQGRRKPLAPQTVHHILSDVRCFLIWAVDSRLIDRCPFPRRVMPRIQERTSERLSDEVCKRLVEAPEPFGFIARLALGTGLRWGELTRAESNDIENGYLVVHQTKSGRLRRVPLSPALLTELEGREGKLVPLRSLTHVTRMLRVFAGTPFHMHQTRHTYACRFLEAGGNLEALQLALGHGTIRVTQRYAKLTDDFVRREAEKGWDQSPQPEKGAPTLTVIEGNAPAAKAGIGA